tara:strand:+ start:422 stop:880 length:459 start_codon:yes stop_codon:yes gene_type:complete
MMRFNPSSYADVVSVYGEAAETEESSSGLPPAAVTAISAVTTALFGGSTREKYEKKLANLETWKAAYERANSQFVKNALAAKIRSLQGEIAALEETAAEERSAERNTQLLKWSGIVLMGGFGLLGITAAFLMIRKAGTEKAKQKQIKTGVAE